MSGKAGGPDVRVRRVYDQPSPEDGQRLLVDRLWPRGLSREHAHVDQWLKEVAPSTELRRWYGHEPARFAEFRRRYASELREPDRAEALMRLNRAARPTYHLPKLSRHHPRRVTAGQDTLRQRASHQE
jgi:uncharacterized protein YeaO (DUF488 family)